MVTGLRCTVTQDAPLTTCWRPRGATWKDCYYVPRTKLDAKQQAEERRKREAEERKASQLRVGTWILRFIANGYTTEDRDRDVSVLLACATVLSNNGGTKAWDKMLLQHLERVEAAGYCLRHRMLPEAAKERWNASSLHR